MRKLLLPTLLTLAYPFLIYFGQGHLSPRWLALVLIAIALTRVASSGQRLWYFAGAGAVVLGAASVIGNGVLPLKLYPLLINATLLAVFAASLRFGPPVIERLARLHEPALPPEGVSYTRKVTWLWCGFFVFNGSVSLATTLWGSEAQWALYNGLLSYLLMGLLFAGEFLYRRRVKTRNSIHA